jgi:hypothetical protein
VTQTILAGGVGVALGALAAGLANIFVLPMVLRHLNTSGSGNEIPGMGDSKAVKLIYRYVMPPCFIGVFATISAIKFGGAA